MWLLFNIGIGRKLMIVRFVLSRVRNNKSWGVLYMVL